MFEISFCHSFDLHLCIINNYKYFNLLVIYISTFSVYVLISFIYFGPMTFFILICKNSLCVKD
jgi:hypothetical protein